MHVAETYNGTWRSDALNSRSRGRASRIRSCVRSPASRDAALLVNWKSGKTQREKCRATKLVGFAARKKKKKKKGMKKEEKFWGGRFSRYSSPPFTLTLIVRSYRSLADNERGRDRITRTRKLGALLE